MAAMLLPQWRKLSLTMNKIGFLIAAIITMTVISCSGNGHGGTDTGDSRPMLLVSIEPQRAIVEKLADNDYQVLSLLNQGTDPETFDPSMQHRSRAAEAKAFFTTGAFLFEQTIAATLPDSVPVVDGTADIELIYGTHGEDSHHHTVADPHIWTSVENVRKMANGITSTLIELVPDSAAIYMDRLDELDSHLDSVDIYIRRTLENRSHTFTVWHPSLSYFARDYGLTQIAVGSESKDSNPRRVRQAIDAAREAGVKVFFYEAGSDSERAESIARDMGARAVEINLMTTDWENTLKYIADELARP